MDFFICLGLLLLGLISEGVLLLLLFLIGFLEVELNIFNIFIIVWKYCKFISVRNSEVNTYLFGVVELIFPGKPVVIPLP